MRRVVEATPRRIVGRCWDPATLAPNAIELVDAGHAPRGDLPADPFPQTPRIECVAVLDRA